MIIPLEFHTFCFYFEANQFDMTMRICCKISSLICFFELLKSIFYILCLYFIFPIFFLWTNLELLLWHLNSARPRLGCEECWLASNKISISIRCFKYLFCEISCGCEIQWHEIIPNEIFVIQVGKTILWNFGMLKAGKSSPPCES